MKDLKTICGIALPYLSEKTNVWCLNGNVNYDVDVKLTNVCKKHLFKETTSKGHIAYF